MLLGALAGTIAGVFGLGGGIIIVPALIMTFTYLHFPVDVLTHLAVGTSLASIVFTSLSSIYVHQKKHAIHWTLVLKLSFGMILGGFLGAYFADFLSGEMLQRIFSLYALCVALQMWFSWRPKAQLHLPKTPGCAFLGMLIGCVSGLFGIAGGSLVVPILALYRVPIKNAIATSATTGFPIALAGAIGYGIMGLNNASLPEYSQGYIYWPACFGIILTSTFFAKKGARLAHRLEPEKVQKLFAIILVIIACKLFI
ncbi:membrane protein [Psychromonas sp. PRT-SC03]|nr:membrane protein [Psychromonas sp. PRT-SC03]